MNGHCRIGKVRRKDSPHLAEIIPAKRGEDYRAYMHEMLDIICDNHLAAKGLAGIVIVGWGFDGRYSTAARFHPDGFVGSKYAPAYVAEMLRARVTEDIACDVFNGKL